MGRTALLSLVVAVVACRSPREERIDHAQSAPPSSVVAASSASQLQGGEASASRSTGESTEVEASTSAEISESVEAAGLASTTTEVPAQDSRADLEDTSVFYEALAPHGDWVQLPTHGWSWVPAQIEPGWRPYTRGHWVWTELGWYWVSDEPFGWATFHYGGWTFDDGYGWCWVPSTTWAPSWVVWRTSPGFIGWAPCPPSAVWQIAAGEVGGFDSVAPSIVVFGWCFCPFADFGSPQVAQLVLLPAYNVTILQKTSVVGGPRLRGGRVLNQGVDATRVERLAGKPVPHARVRDLESARELRVASTDGDELPASRRELRTPRGGLRPVDASAPREATQQQLEEYGEFRKRETARWNEYQRGELERLQRLHQRELGQTRGEAAVRELRLQHQAQLDALEAQRKREMNALEQRQQKLPARAAPDRP